jgi:hypothetical protein
MAIGKQPPTLTIARILPVVVVSEAIETSTIGGGTGSGLRSLYKNGLLRATCWRLHRQFCPKWNPA